MHQMKQKAIFLLIILILGGTGVYLYLKSRKVPEYHINNLISNEAAFFLNIQNPGKLMDNMFRNNAIWDELAGIPSLKNFQQAVKVVDSLYQSEKPFRKLLHNRKMILMAEKIGRDRTGFTFLLKLEHQNEQRHIRHYFEIWGNQKNHQLKSKKYNQVRIYSIYRNDKHLFSYANAKGILISGTSQLLIEQAIRQSSVKKNMANNPYFKKVAETAGKHVSANLFINFNHFAEFIAIALDKPYQNYIQNLSIFAQWSALDVNIKSDALLLNGFSVSDQNQKEIIDLFGNQNPVEFELENILPYNTAGFISLGISDKTDYRKRLHGLYQEKDVLMDYQQWLEQITSQYQFNPEEIFYDLLHQEIGIAYMPMKSGNPKDRAFIILKTKGRKYAKSKLSQVSEKMVNSKDQTPLSNNITIDKETRYPVYYLPIDNIFGNLFGDLFQDISNRYAILIGRYAIFTGDQELLREFAYSNILHKTLKNNPKYQNFTDYLSDRINFHFYANMYRSPSVISSFLKEDLQQSFARNHDHFSKFQALAYQMLNSNGMPYNNLFVKYIPEINNQPQTVWETYLDTTLNMKPALVTNHYTGENEIFIQDLHNKVYLINKVGRILWEKQLDEQIMGDIYQIDYYKNGKLQMLFNTPNKIHLIARNGNHVERYPIRLPAPATAPLNVFDYNNNKNYRIFIPCANNKVYDFNKEGDILPGWQFGKTDSEVTGRVQHFRVNTKDYIVFADTYQIFILNRRGNARVIPEEQFARSKNNLFTLEEKNARTQPRLVTTDINGTIHYVYFNGKVETSEIHTFSPDHHFGYRDVNANGLKDFVFLDDNKMEVYASPDQEIFEHTFKADITTPPIYFQFSQNDRKLGVASANDNLIFLLNGDGSLYKGFPLEGNTPFTIGFLDPSKQKFNILVGSKYKFLYNYSIK